jgi:hypothetical protein
VLRRKKGFFVSYREENGQVILTLSWEDYQNLLITIGYAAGSMNTNGDQRWYRECYLLLNRLNSGNPSYTPYQLPEKSS